MSNRGDIGQPAGIRRSSVFRLGVLGGSFDPPHVAHLIMADTVREALSLDLVLFVPARQQPLKEDRQATPAEQRVEMVQLAIEGNPHFGLSRVDLDRPGPSYTADTLELLRGEWNAIEELWFILGSDSLLTLPRWHDPHRVLAGARLAAVRRPGSAPALDPLFSRFPELQSRLDLVDAPLIEISATDIRRRVSEGLSIRYRVPKAVREYIEAKGLYRG